MTTPRTALEDCLRLAELATPGEWKITPRSVEEDGSIYPKYIIGENCLQVCPLELECIARIAYEKPGTFWDTSKRKEANAQLIISAINLLRTHGKALSEALGAEVVGLAEVRQAVADYMLSEGCGCCRGDEHEDNKVKLGKLLHAPAYSDGSGFDFSTFRSNYTPPTSAKGSEKV